MKKSEQLTMNDAVLNVYEEVRERWESEVYAGTVQPIGKLRNCSATVFEDGDFYYLMSYRTLVAVIEKKTDTLVDFLRYVYGYTSTSAQHISKFEKDYCKGKWNCEHRLTWRYV